MIPPHLIRSIPDSSTSFKMVLKVAWGSSWPIKISKNPSFHYMEKFGWDQFVRDNALGNNEFITFTHKGNMCFSVNIYQIDCKEILKPIKFATIASSSSGRNKREQEKKEEIVSSSESIYPFHKTAESTGRRQGLSLGKKKSEETDKSKKKKKRKVKTVCNDSKAGTSSRVPEFTLTIKKSYLLFLGVPKKFAEMHMPRESKVFKIHHSKGKKTWEATYVVSDVQSRFSAGWIRLAKELGLVVGDVCTFTLVKPTEMVLSVSKNRTP
ncbi:unnamed protein product [Microthlaspi erraticum]|uniref:TF-B3 domain-containing protein n=1 Tax=Microthlaspi erraticum TaxID=1685480 RepID=A0A6D2L9P2_9BRAS|nr:unnamed protein product [Microthlaspi erraticum]